MSNKYPVAYLIGWIEGEIEQAEEDGAKDRFIEIHRAIITKLKAGETLRKVAKAYWTMPLSHIRADLLKAINEQED